MAKKDTNAERSTRQIRVSIQCRDRLDRMARRRGVTMGALVGTLLDAETERVKQEKRVGRGAVNARYCADPRCPQRVVVTERETCSFCNGQTAIIGRVIEIAPLTATGISLFQDAEYAAEQAMRQALGGRS
jgi:hypothetical protein